MSANGKSPFLTPQQELFLSLYTNPKSETFSNALQSALKAGYSQEYSENITYQLPDWLSENIGDLKRLRKAEKVLDKTLELEAVTDDGKVDNALLKTQTDVAKFVANTMGRIKYHSKGEESGETLAKAITGMRITKEDNGDSIQNEE